MRVVFTLTIVSLFLFPGAPTHLKMAAPGGTAASIQAATNPGPANHMLYDVERRQVILLTASQQSGREEVWRWDGKGWQLIPGPGPTARELSAAAYDTHRKSIVLHGGSASNPAKIAAAIPGSVMEKTGVR
jgi:hypothetical protein